MLSEDSVFRVRLSIILTASFATFVANSSDDANAPAKSTVTDAVVFTSMPFFILVLRSPRTEFS